MCCGPMEDNMGSITVLFAKVSRRIVALRGHRLHERHSVRPHQAPPHLVLTSVLRLTSTQYASIQLP